MTVAEAPPREVFELREAVSLSEASVAADGTIPLVVIRPTVGRGKGRHLYTAEMLKENSHVFGDQRDAQGNLHRPGWKMFLDHQSEEAKRAAGGLPRSVRDLAGRVIESWWDESLPADGRYGQGGVVARVRPTRYVRELIQDDAEILEASINARATSVRPIQHNGQRVWLVEGIEDRGSVDFVTEGGAGGRVAALMESVYHDEHAEDNALLDTLSDEELVAKLRKDRPELIEALASEPPAPPVKTDPPKADPPDEPVDVLTVLTEALRSDEGRVLLREAVGDALSDERDLIRAEARADADRVIQLHSMEREAHNMIEAAKLSSRWEANLKERFSLSEAGPSYDLDVVDEIDEETRQVTRPAEAILRESVTGAITEARDLISSTGGGTRVRGQGPVQGDGKPDERKRPSLYRDLLQEAGFEDPETVYAED